MVMRPLAFLEGLRERFGDIFTVRVVDERPWVLVSDPDLIGLIFKAPTETLRAGEAREILRPFLGDSSVMLLDGEAHAQQRRLLLPPFGGGRLERYTETMREAAAHAVAAWPRGVAEPAARWTRAIALEVILRVVFGVKGDRRLESLRAALQSLRAPQNAREAAAPAFREAIAQVDALLFAEIAERRRSAAGGAQGDDVLSLLFEARHEDGRPMSDREIRDELMTLLAAGYETTATTLAWTLEQLARRPAALAEVEREADGGGGPYTDAAIKEALRIRPALPVIVRTATAPFRLGRYELPAGTMIMPAILLVHHRADLYPDPGAFRPERFLGSPPDTNTWIPFGGGSRRCIGARFALHEMGIVLATLLAKVRPHPARTDPEPMRRRDITLTPAHGAELVLQPR
jgi:cytochrome P450